MTNERTPVEDVIETIATADDVDPASMTPPLATAIDPEALNELVARGSTGADRHLEVAFTYRGHEVVVDERGTVELD